MTGGEGAVEEMSLEANERQTLLKKQTENSYNQGLEKQQVLNAVRSSVKE